MLRSLLYFFGLCLHVLSYLNIKKKDVKKCVILMGGPSVDETVFESHYDCSMTANLTDPERHCSLISADKYFHCFSDPSIVEDPAKREMFEKILKFAITNRRYKIVIPVQYLQYVSMWRKFLNAGVLVYNQYSTWPKKRKFCLGKYVFPNMKTIFLDCALPWNIYIGAQQIFVAGFDADYGSGENKSYSSIATKYIEKNEADRAAWGNSVMNSTDMYLHVFESWSDCEITFAPNSGYAKYLEAKRGD